MVHVVWMQVVLAMNEISTVTTGKVSTLASVRCLRNGSCGMDAGSGKSISAVTTGKVPTLASVRCLRNGSGGIEEVMTSSCHS